MSVYSIKSDIEFVETDNKSYRETFIITCDGQADNNSFDYEAYGDDDFVIERDRCKLNVYIKENKTPNDKYFVIVCTHSNDSSVYVQIEIIQKAEDFKIEQELQTHTFSSIVTLKQTNTSDANYNYYEEHTFPITVIGGSKKYRIEDITRYHIEDKDTEDERVINYQFDNGFVYTKKSNAIVIKSYGRPFLEENDYYIITICHNDKRDVKAEIKIMYSAIPSTTTRSVRRTRKGVKIMPQVSDIYMPYDEFMKRIEEQKRINIENNKVDCSIKFREEIGDEYVVNGMVVNIVIPFDIYENGAISDLMVKKTSTGNWCSVKIDETNRNLKIRILNNPIGERKCFVKLSVVDYPSANASFILVNKPL